jgi:hypothetical protein
MPGIPENTEQQVKFPADLQPFYCPETRVQYDVAAHILLIFFTISSLFF